VPPLRVCRSFIVCQCIAGGAVRRATSAVMRFRRGGGCGGCGVSDSPVGGGAARPRSCHLSAGEYDMPHMCARCSVAARHKVQHTIQSATQSTSTNMQLLIPAKMYTKLAHRGVYAVYVTYIYLCPVSAIHGRIQRLFQSGRWGWPVCLAYFPARRRSLNSDTRPVGRGVFKSEVL